MNLIEMDMSR